jgi:hypothetical protein
MKRMKEEEEESIGKYDDARDSGGEKPPGH